MNYDKNFIVSIMAFSRQTFVSRAGDSLPARRSWHRFSAPIRRASCWKASSSALALVFARRSRIRFRRSAWRGEIISSMTKFPSTKDVLVVVFVRGAIEYVLCMASDVHL